MEKLKSVVPKALQQIIAESTPDDLPSTCSSLLDFFQQLPLFHQIVRDLTDPETSLCRKNKEAGLELKRKGNECYSMREYSDALRLYSEALRVTPADADDTYNNLVATLYVNRATVLRKMDFQVESLQDCNRALLISPSYAKGWYRRGQANASLRKYEEAASDLNVSINMELSLSGKKQIEKEMRLILDQPKESSSLSGKTSENNMDFPDESHKLKVQCVFTPTKGRAMASQTDIPQASLIHTEEPFAAIILKQCRDTHCHFCFNELPMDTVPCSSCSIPLYCSQQCQIQAGGKMGNDSKNNSIQIKLPNDLKKYIEKITLSNSLCKCIPEHLHECQGVHWSAILPSEIVLIGRVLVKYIEQQRQFGPVTGLKDLCHHYVQLSSEEKMELHIYSIILLYCLQLSYGAELPVSGVMISQAMAYNVKLD